MWKQRELLWADAVADLGGGGFGSLGFVVLRACVGGLVRADERSRKLSGQRNPPFQNPRSATWMASRIDEAEKWYNNYTHFHLALE